MDKNTRTRAAVKITEFTKAVATQAFGSWTSREAQVVAFLLSHGGHWHCKSHQTMAEMLGLARSTYYWTTDRLRRRGIIASCVNCPNERFGIGWSVQPIGHWVSKPLDGSVQYPAHSDSPNLVLVQGEGGFAPRQEGQEGEERLLTQPGPPDREGVVKPTNDDWAGASLGAGDVNKPPPKKGASPTTRLRFAFQDECQRHREYWGVPVTPSVKQMMGGLKWLLDQGYSEDVIKASFSFLGNVLSRQSVGPHRTMWEVYYQNKAELLKQGAMSMVGTRPGQKRESLLEQAQRRNRAVQ